MAAARRVSLWTGSVLLVLAPKSASMGVPASPSSALRSHRPAPTILSLVSFSGLPDNHECLAGTATLGASRTGSW